MRWNPVQAGSSTLAKSSSRKSMALVEVGEQLRDGFDGLPGTRVVAYSERAVSRSPALMAATNVATRAANRVACART